MHRSGERNYFVFVVPIGDSTLSSIDLFVYTMKTRMFLALYFLMFVVISGLMENLAEA